MKTEIDIRLAVKSDIPEIVALMREAFSYIVDKTIYGCSGICRYIEDNLDNPSCAYIVAQMGGRIVGAIEYRITDTEICLNYIALSKEIRGKGYATEIFERSLALTPEKRGGGIVLDVFAKNTVAYNWYKKLGFRVTGTNIWNEVLFVDDNDCGEYNEINANRNKQEYERYGFSVFEFKAKDRIYSVRIFGDKWIRVREKEVLLHPGILAIVKSSFPGRRIFSVVDGDLSGSTGLEFRPIIDGYQMEREQNK